MRGMIAVDDVIASLPKERQKKISAWGNELLEKVQRRMTLSEIRKARKISQAKMAEALGIGQMQISRLEKRKDPRLSTIQRTVAAMGGHLMLPFIEKHYRSVLQDLRASGTVEVTPVTSKAEGLKGRDLVRFPKEQS